MRLQTSGGAYSFQTSNFQRVDTEGATLILHGLPGLELGIDAFMRGAKNDEVNVVVCWHTLGPIDPASYPGTGPLRIPLEDGPTALSVADVMTDQLSCDAFLEAVVEPPSAASLLPPPAAQASPAGLTITSPSDSYTVPFSDVIASDTVFDAATNQYQLVLTFAPATATWIASETAAHVGEVFQLSVCGIVLNEPLIRSPLQGRTILLTGAGPRAQAAIEMARISGDAPCP